MSIEAVESLGETPDDNFQYADEGLETIWNGRFVSLGKICSKENISAAILTLLTEHSLEPKPTTCGFLENYFDSDLKKKNEFDLAVYQYHIRCNSEESKKALESAFEKMAYGMVGVVVGVAMFPASPYKGVFMIYNCGAKVWQGVEDFKRAIATSGTNLDEVSFVTNYEDLKRNTDELMNSTILEPWKPLDNSGFKLMDEQYKRQLLDPTFNPWKCA